MPIPDSVIDQIQERTDIVEVISRYVSLKKAGRSFKANCPFHNEKTPSFVVSADKQIYHCFGCGAGGNVFSFLMRQEGLEFPEAVEMLAEKAGVPFKRSSGAGRADASLANRLFSINDAAAEFFQGCLATNGAAKEYLVSRGVGDAIGKQFRLGYAPDSWDALISFFAKKDISTADLEKAGLAIPNDRGGHYDRFRKRIIFPITDLRGRTLGFGARVMDASLPKYMNSPETAIYSKGRNLYGLSVSKEPIKKAGHALIVEGYLDFLIPFQAGVTNIVATLGTALTVDQARALKRFAGTVIMVYDPDEAGEAASIRNLDLFVTENMNVYVAELPKGYDPDGFIKKFGAEDFNKLIKAGKNLFEYKFAKVAARYDVRTSHGKAAVASEMLPTIARVDNAVMKANLVKRLAERLSVDEESIREELKKVRLDPGERRAQQSVTPAAAKPTSSGAERMVLALMLEGGDAVRRVKETLRLDEFKDTSIRDVVGAIITLKDEDKEISAARIISRLGTTEGAALLISEGANLAEMIADKDRSLDDCIARIKKDAKDDLVKLLKEEIRRADTAGSHELVSKLQNELNGLIKQGTT